MGKVILAFLALSVAQVLSAGERAESAGICVLPTTLGRLWPVMHEPSQPLRFRWPEGAVRAELAFTRSVSRDEVRPDAFLRAESGPFGECPWPIADRDAEELFDVVIDFSDADGARVLRETCSVVYLPGTVGGGAFALRTQGDPAWGTLREEARLVPYDAAFYPQADVSAGFALDAVQDGASSYGRSLDGYAGWTAWDSRNLPLLGGGAYLLRLLSGEQVVDCAELVNVTFIGADGMVVDTEGADRSLNDEEFVRERDGGLVKNGEGALAIDNPNNFGSIAVNGGSVRFRAAGHDPKSSVSDVTAQDLAHRWSFNGDFRDSFGGQDAVGYGSYSLSATDCSLPGDGKGGVSYVDLGSDAIPTNGSAVTIEIWVRNDTAFDWARMFHLGEDAANNRLFFAFTRTSAAAGGLSPGRGTSSKASPTSYSVEEGQFTFACGTQYHLSLVLAPPEADETQWTYTIRQYDASTGSLVKKYSARLNEGWTLLNHGMTQCWLGRSADADADAAATYDEVRVWRTALSEERLAAHARQGPDGLPYLSGEPSAPALVSVAETAALDLGGTDFGLMALLGGGTVSNGVLSITGSVFPGGSNEVGTLTLDCPAAISRVIAAELGDEILCSDNLDLTGSRLVVTDLQDLGERTPCRILRAEGMLIGRPEADNLFGTGFTVRKEGSEIWVRRKSSGLTIIFR